MNDNIAAAENLPACPELKQLLGRKTLPGHELIELLHAAQQLYGHLDLPLLGQIARRLKLPESLVYGVASFYHAFRLEPPGRTRCAVCTGTSCHIKGGTRLLEQLQQRLGPACGGSSADSLLSLESVRCLGACGMAPLVRIEQNSTPARLYSQMTPDLTLNLLQAAMESGLPPGEALAPVRLLGPASQRIVLANCGAVDPDSLASARAAGAYTALEQALRRMSPTQVCGQISDSGLRGRGGAGYPTGLKWELVRSAPGKRKFVVANGDEGDPGAFMDRTLMEQDPHRVLEGMAIAGFATGADHGFIYVRGEYPLAAQRLRTAIAAAESAACLGLNIFGTPFSFRVRVRIGAGAFVCGEETALMASIMGRRGQPVIRPPYPAQHGLWGHSTLINNVETFGCVAAIILKGAAWYNSIGTPGNSGTKVFSISGDVAVAGVVEVPLGTPLREILELAGGVTGGAFKAAQTGGASGGCLTAEHLDIPVDYDSLSGLGTIMGSGGMVIINDRRCMVDLARFFMRFCQSESCGKCAPCRAGTEQALRLLDALCAGEADLEQLERLEELCHLMRETSLCGLGMAAPNPVLSTLRWFRQEYLDHLRSGHCPAGVCRRGEAPCRD